MIIHFKNGLQKEVSQEIVEILKERILNSCGDFQIFTDENNNAFLFINVSEIVVIENKKADCKDKC